MNGLKGQLDIEVLSYCGVVLMISHHKATTCSLAMSVGLYVTLKCPPSFSTVCLCLCVGARRPVVVGAGTHRYSSLICRVLRLGTIAAELE